MVYFLESIYKLVFMKTFSYYYMLIEIGMRLKEI